jgi:hypothetical protein
MLILCLLKMVSWPKHVKAINMYKLNHTGSFYNSIYVLFCQFSFLPRGPNGELPKIFAPYSCWYILQTRLLRPGQIIAVDFLDAVRIPVPFVLLFSTLLKFIFSTFSLFWKRRRLMQSLCCMCAYASPLIFSFYLRSVLYQGGLKHHLAVWVSVCPPSFLMLMKSSCSLCVCPPHIFVFCKVRVVSSWLMG